MQYQFSSCCFHYHWMRCCLTFYSSLQCGMHLPSSECTLTLLSIFSIPRQLVLENISEDSCPRLEKNSRLVTFLVRKLLVGVARPEQLPRVELISQALPPGSSLDILTSRLTNCMHSETTSPALDVSVPRTIILLNWYVHTLNLDSF